MSFRQGRGQQQETQKEENTHLKAGPSGAGQGRGVGLRAPEFGGKKRRHVLRPKAGERLERPALVLAGVVQVHHVRCFSGEASGVSARKDAEGMPRQTRTVPDGARHGKDHSHTIVRGQGRADVGTELHGVDRKGRQAAAEEEKKGEAEG